MVEGNWIALKPDSSSGLFNKLCSVYVHGCFGETSSFIVPLLSRAPLYKQQLPLRLTVLCRSFCSKWCWLQSAAARLGSLLSRPQQDSWVSGRTFSGVSFHNKSRILNDMFFFLFADSLCTTWKRKSQRESRSNSKYIILSVWRQIIFFL